MKAILILLVGLFAIVSIGQAITLKEMDNKINDLQTRLYTCVEWNEVFVQMAFNRKEEKCS